jgi:hypothetical protein
MPLIITNTFCNFNNIIFEYICVSYLHIFILYEYKPEILRSMFIKIINFNIIFF